MSGQIKKPGSVVERVEFLRILFVVTIVAAVFFSGACRAIGFLSQDESATPTATRAPAVTATPSYMEIFDDGRPLAPQVVEQQPRPGQEMPLDGEIVITFDQAMDHGATRAAWQVVGPEGEILQGEVAWPTPRTLHFQPADPLQTSGAYLATLTTGATSAEGVPLADPLTFRFNAVGELQVDQVFPQDGTEDVENDVVITVIFNRPVVPLVIAEEQTNLPDPVQISPDVSGHGEWISTSVYTFRPDRPMKGGTTYTVAVKAGLADSGEETQLTEDYEWQFVTAAPSISNFELSERVTNPDEGYYNVLLDEYFSISFHQSMNESSTEAALSLTSQSGEPVSLSTSWNEDSSRVVFTPTQRLAVGTGYTLRLDQSAQAADGGALREGLHWSFTTVQSPAIVTISPADGTQPSRFSSELEITFASPMNFDSLKDKVVITPQPQGEVRWWYNDWNWSISTYVLQPSTRYEIRTLPGMEDIYGNSIMEGRTVRFTTAAYDPHARLQMPYLPSVFRVGGPQVFYADYRNVESIELKLFRLSTETFISLLKGISSRREYNPPAQDLIWEHRQQNTGKLNQRTLESFLPTTGDGERLPPGFYFLAIDSGQISHRGIFIDNRLLIVASANLAFKTTATEALMWLTDLASGEPIEGASLTVYDENFQPIDQGVTDSEGLLYMTVPAPADPYEDRYVIVNADLQDASQHFAFASSEWGSGVSMYDYGLWSSYYAPPNQPTVYAYTDRPLYRPDQPVYFKGIVRLDDDLDYSLPDQREVEVTIDSFQETVYEEVLPLSPFGSFDGELLLDEQAALGNYTLHVRYPGSDEIIGRVGFNVAEYRKPEFKVDVSADPTDVLAGETYTIKVGAEYYSGGGVGDADVNWTLTAEPFTFSPSKDYAHYRFSDFESDAGYFDEFGPSSREVIAEGQGRTDENGHLVLTLPADLSESKSSRQFTFEASITDLAGNVVSGRASVVAHRSAVYAGVRPETYVGTAGREQSFELVVLDWDSNPGQSQNVSVEVVERRWYSVQEQDAQGRIRWSSTVEEIPVASFADLSIGEDGKAAVSFTPPSGGIYRAKVTALDARGNPARASAYMWVAGTSYIPWRQTNDRSFELVADRASYSPGDTAEILIASPFQGEAYALITVERGHIRHREVILLTNNSTIYKLPITADMAPNTYVSVVIVKGVDETNARPNFKMGILELEVDTREQAVFVEVIPDRAQAGPGEKVSYTIRTRDSQGKPVSAEVSLGLSDLATLSLSDPNSPPILDYFYSQRTLRVWTSMPIVLSIEDYNASIEEYLTEGEGMGSGGGKGGDEWGVIEIREDFPDTAYWEAHLLTGDDGEATVDITLPDNLTTWRMDARAVTLDTRVGQITQDIISTRPLLVRPQTPRFFVVGDEAVLGAAVHNNTDQSMSVNVTLTAKGVDLQDQVAQVVEIPAERQAYVSWSVTVRMDADRVDLVFDAEGVAADGRSYSDASRPTMGTLDNQGIPVYRYEARETVGTSGQMLEGGSRLEAISLPSSLEAAGSRQGQLTIQIAPSLAAGMTDGLKYLEDYPYECVEQTISRFLPNVITTRAFRAAGLGDPDLESNLKIQVNTSLQRIYNWQNPDGGWGWWSEQKSDVQTTAYVVLGLIEAGDAGYTISSGVMERGAGYLRANLNPLSRITTLYKLNRQAFVLYVLAREGNPEVSRTVQIYEQRQDMSLYARAYLAHTLFIIDPEDPRLQTLLSDFASAAVLSATGSHWEESETDRWNWNTDTRTTAIVLSALSQIDPQNPVNHNAVRWLMSHRTNGHWRSTQETAWTLMALSNWMVASGELQADYEYAVAFNGERLGGGVADSESLRQTYLLYVDVADMLTGEANRLLFARDDGPGNLYYTAHLDISLPVEEITALDQGIIVSRSYFHPDDHTTPVSQAQRGDLLLARLTLVAPKALHYVVVDDPLPGGLEAVDQSLSTSPQAIVPQEYTWDDLVYRGWGWWYFDHVELRDEKVTLSANYLPAGTYIYTYLVRAGTQGTFRTIPPTAQEFYFPEVYGRGDGSLFTVVP